ncbi:MAG: hypothetical protein R2856_27615 [Caldilineaceae bacterium]
METDRAFAVDGVAGVEHQVHERLLKRGFIDIHGVGARHNLQVELDRRR